jgi:glycoprotein 2-beta-D-xylosyltransferase
MKKKRGKEKKGKKGKRKKEKKKNPWQNVPVGLDRGQSEGANQKKMSARKKILQFLLIVGAIGLIVLFSLLSDSPSPKGKILIPQEVHPPSQIRPSEQKNDQGAGAAIPEPHKEDEREEKVSEVSELKRPAGREEVASDPVGQEDLSFTPGDLYADWKLSYDADEGRKKDPFFSWRQMNKMAGGLKCTPPASSSPLFPSFTALFPSPEGGSFSPLSCYKHHLNPHVYCELEAPGLVIDPSKITFMRKGGEALEQVMGQDEQVEFPHFHQGWLSLPASLECEDEGATRLTSSLPHHLPTTLGLMDLRGPEPRLAAEQRRPRTLLAVMRYEYVNLYHTMTDWFNTCDALDHVFAEHLAKEADDVDILFLDAHPQGSLDFTWTTLYGRNALFISELGELGGLEAKYERVVFVSPGYSSPITYAATAGIPGVQNPAPAVLAFQEFFLRRYRLFEDDLLVDRLASLTVEQEGKNSHLPSFPPTAQSSSKWLTIIFRGNYRPHPRHSGLTTRRISNEEELMGSIADILGTQEGKGEWGVRGIHLEEVELRQQVALFRSSHLILSVHGAALSSVLFMRSGTVVIEMQPPSFIRPHFIPFAAAVGVSHVTHPLEEAWGDGPYTVTAERIAKRVLEVVREKFPGSTQ